MLSFLIPTPYCVNLSVMSNIAAILLTAQNPAPLTHRNSDPSFLLCGLDFTTLALPQTPFTRSGCAKVIRRIQYFGTLRTYFVSVTVPKSGLAPALIETDGRTTWFLRIAAASSLEHHTVCKFACFVVAFWFATPRTPPLWQREFFLVNCSVLRSLLASERSGVVKTFRYPLRDYGPYQTQLR